MSEKFETISAFKANHLFWLGRYAQRVYLSLHFMRRICDELIDGAAPDYQGYFDKLGIKDVPADRKSFYLSEMYDASNPSSIVSELNRAYDNAVVLREEIKSESLAYIELSLSLTQKFAREQETNITLLQPVTDYMLAFFGCLYERVNSLSIRDLINIGRHLESLDMLLRFDYPAERIVQVYQRLKECQARQSEVFNQQNVEKLDALLLGLNGQVQDFKAQKSEILGLIRDLTLL